MHGGGALLPSLKTRTLDKASSRAKDGTCSSCDDIVAAREHQKCKVRTPTFDTPYSTCLFQLLLSKRQERKHNEQRKLQQHQFNLGNGAFFQMFETTNLLRLPWFRAIWMKHSQDICRPMTAICCTTAPYKHADAGQTSRTLPGFRIL